MLPTRPSARTRAPMTFRSTNLAPRLLSQAIDPMVMKFGLGGIGQPSVRALPAPGLPLPPVVIPGTPENNAFAHAFAQGVEGAGRAATNYLSGNSAG